VSYAADPKERRKSPARRIHNADMQTEVAPALYTSRKYASRVNIPYMYAIFDIADDVLQAAQDIALREGKTVGRVISELARSGMQSRPALESSRPPRETHGFRPFPKRGGVLTNELISKLREGTGD
jgi:hypothetical protein